MSSVALWFECCAVVARPGASGAMPAPRQHVPQVAAPPVETSRGGTVAGWESDSSYYSYCSSLGEESAATSDLPAGRNAASVKPATQAKERKAKAEASSGRSRRRGDSSTSRSSSYTSYSRTSSRTALESSAVARSLGEGRRTGRSRSLRRSRSGSLHRRTGRSRSRSLGRCRSRGRSTSRRPHTRLRGEASCGQRKTPRQAERQGRGRQQGASSANQQRRFAQPVARSSLRQRLDASLGSRRSVPSPPRTLAERLDAPLTREQNWKGGPRGDRRTAGKGNAGAGLAEDVVRGSGKCALQRPGGQRPPRSVAHAHRRPTSREAAAEASPGEART